MVGVIAAGADALGWGATGHEWVSGIAIEKLPESVPEFVRMPEAVAEISVMGREPDRSRGAGKTHDAERARQYRGPVVVREHHRQTDESAESGEDDHRARFLCL